MAVLANGCGGGGVDRGDISCPGMINWMAGVVVAVNNMVNCSSVTSVESSASPSAALEYALCAALSCVNMSPIFLHVDVSGKLCPGNFFVNVFVTVSRLGTLVLSFVTFVWGGVGFKHSAITIISLRFLSVIVFITVSTLAKRAKFQTGMRASWYASAYFLYALPWMSSVSELISSSNVSRISCIASRNS